jgi:hypothetical protein
MTAALRLAMLWLVTSHPSGEVSAAVQARCTNLGYDGGCKRVSLVCLVDMLYWWMSQPADCGRGAGPIEHARVIKHFILQWIVRTTHMLHDIRHLGFPHRTHPHTQL